MAFGDENEELEEAFEIPDQSVDQDQECCHEGPLFNLENEDTPAVLEAALLEATSEIGDRVRLKMKKDK